MRAGRDLTGEQTLLAFIPTLEEVTNLAFAIPRLVVTMRVPISLYSGLD